LNDGGHRSACNDGRDRPAGKTGKELTKRVAGSRFEAVGQEHHAQQKEADAAQDTCDHVVEELGCGRGLKIG
jgi:hypothetical protein